MRLLIPLASILGLLSGATAQTAVELKKELAEREAKAATAETLLTVAEWAKEKALDAEYKRLLNRVLKLEPNNEKAMLGLGFVLHNGNWLPKAKAEELRAAEADAANKAKGLEKVDGVWVDRAEVADARKGIFHHEGERVTKEEKLAFNEGKVRHPITGELIAAADLEKAENGMFPLAASQWGTAEEANAYHADVKHPWSVRTAYATILTTLPLEQHNELKILVDSSIDIVKPLFGSAEVKPSDRPVVIVTATTDEYTQVGAAIGAETSVYGAFLAEADRRLPDLELSVRAGVANWGVADWGPYYLRHASGVAYANAVAAGAGGSLPLWFLAGAGALAERHFTPETSKFFGNQHLAKGGVKDLKAWFAAFEISANIQAREVEYNIYQAGLALLFCLRGKDTPSTTALQRVATAAAEGKNLDKAVQKLEETLLTKEEALRAFLKDILQ